MSTTRDDLMAVLRQTYHARGWKFAEEDGVLVATGTGGVTWLGMVVLAGDLDRPETAGRIRDLSDRRMPTGELSPLDLLAEPGAEPGINALLAELGVGHRRHISVFSLTQAALAA